MHKIRFVFMLFFHGFTKAQISLEYTPMLPFYHPNPGSILGQIVPPGKPWPDSPEGYLNFSQTTPRIENKFKETTTVSSTTSQKQNEETLEYKPMSPPFHPNPGDNVGQIVPPGKPWPSSPDGDQNFSQVPSSTNQPSMGSSSSETINTISLDEGLKENSTQPPRTDLEYKPTRPFYYPNPGNNISQIVPPGKPWPDSPEGYQNFSQIPSSTNQPSMGFSWSETSNTITLADSLKENSTQPPRTDLEYKPTRPSFHPNPGNNVGQLVPSGTPWPDSPEGYQNFSQVPSSTNQPSIGSSVSETISTISLDERLKENSTQPPRTDLEYKPTRPFHHPNPGNNIDQIVPPAKPWPDSLEGYQNFSQIPSSTNQPSIGFSWSENTISLVDRLKENSTQPPSTDLEYKPNRPFYDPKPCNNVSQIVPSGKPRPVSPEGHQNFSQIPSSTNQPLMGSSSSETTSTISLNERLKENSTQPPRTDLEYKPTRPFYHPNPGNNIGELVPPGKPWPDSPEGYQNFSQVPSSTNPPSMGFSWFKTTNSVGLESTLKENATESSGDEKSSSDGKPEEITATEKPWLSSTEPYENFSQNQANLEDRLKENEDLTTTGMTSIPEMTTQIFPTSTITILEEDSTNKIDAASTLETEPDTTQITTSEEPQPDILEINQKITPPGLPTTKTSDIAQEETPVTNPSDFIWHDIRKEPDVINFHHRKNENTLGQIIANDEFWTQNRDVVSSNTAAEELNEGRLFTSRPEQLSLNDQKVQTETPLFTSAVHKIEAMPKTETSLKPSAKKEPPTTGAPIEASLEPEKSSTKKEPPTTAVPIEASVEPEKSSTKKKPPTTGVPAEASLEPEKSATKKEPPTTAVPAEASLEPEKSSTKKEPPTTRAPMRKRKVQIRRYVIKFPFFRPFNYEFRYYPYF